MTNITLFSQIISILERSKFNNLAKVKQTNNHGKGYTSKTYLNTMLICLFAKSQTVRDISYGLRSATGYLNHLGIVRAHQHCDKNHQLMNRTSIDISNSFQSTRLSRSNS